MGPDAGGKNKQRSSTFGGAPLCGPALFRLKPPGGKSGGAGFRYDKPVIPPSPVCHTPRRKSEDERRLVKACFPCLRIKSTRRLHSMAARRDPAVVPFRPGARPERTDGSSRVAGDGLDDGRDGCGASALRSCCHCHGG